MTHRASLLALASAAALLAACGSSNDASTEATADTVEMPADEALAPVTAAPVADAEANTPDPAASASPDAAAAGDAAADVAAEAASAASAATTAADAEADETARPPR